MNDPTRGRVRDPLRIATAGRDPAVEAHRPLGDHPRSTRADEAAERRREPCGRLLQNTALDLEAGGPQARDPATVDRRKGIARSDHHSTDPRRDHRGRAGGSLAVVAAGLERHHEGAGAGRLPRSLQRHHLGVRAAMALVPSLADDPSVGREHNGADLRIRLHEAFATAGQFEGPLHCRHFRSHVSCRGSRWPSSLPAGGPDHLRRASRFPHQTRLPARLRLIRRRRALREQRRRHGPRPARGGRCLPP